MSGWSARSTPIDEPGRAPSPPAASAAMRNMRRKPAGPDAAPPVERTAEPSGRRRENENAVPAPCFAASAAFLAAVKMPSMLSSTGSTQHADRKPSRRPAE